MYFAPPPRAAATHCAALKLLGLKSLKRLS